MTPGQFDYILMNLMPDFATQSIVNLAKGLDHRFNTSRTGLKHRRRIHGGPLESHAFQFHHAFCHLIKINTVDRI